MNNVTRDCIKRLYDNQPLSGEQISECIREIMTGIATHSQTGAFLMLLQSRPLDTDILMYSASSLLSLSLPFKWSSDSVDIVGTGGDAISTFNASTAASMISAAAGVVSTKHGNRSSSGKCGSADFIEALGARMDLTGEHLVPIVKKLNYGFLWAQTFHPSFKHVSPVRKELGVRTIFNVLGPLVNPAKPTHMIAGVANVSLGNLYAQVLLKTGSKRSMVINSLDGLDEITPSANTRVWFIENGTIEEKILTPQDFGVDFHPLERIVGSTPEENVKTFKRLLDSKADEADENLKAVIDFVAMNAGAAIYVFGLAKDLKEGTRIAKETIFSGKAKKLVEDYVKATHEVI